MEIRNKVLDNEINIRNDILNFSIQNKMIYSDNLYEILSGIVYISNAFATMNAMLLDGYFREFEGMSDADKEDKRKSIMNFIDLNIYAMKKDQANNDLQVLKNITSDLIFDGGSYTIVINLSDIYNGFINYVNILKDMAMDKDCKNWKKLYLGQIDKCLDKVFMNIIKVAELLQDIFLEEDGSDHFKIDIIERYRRKEFTFNKISDISKNCEYMFCALDDIYSVIVSILHSTLYSIDISTGNSISYVNEANRDRNNTGDSDVINVFDDF